MSIARRITLACALGLSACASTGVGIDRRELPVSLQPLHDRAQLGDKQSQFELGVAFSEGLVVERDCTTARRLLRKAASDSGGTLWVYSPSVGNGTQGRVIPIDQGPKQSGLKSAEEMLNDPQFCKASDS